MSRPIVSSTVHRCTFEIRPSARRDRTASCRHGTAWNLAVLGYAARSPASPMVPGTSGSVHSATAVRGTSTTARWSTRGKARRVAGRLEQLRRASSYGSAAQSFRPIHSRVHNAMEAYKREKSRRTRDGVDPANHAFSVRFGFRTLSPARRPLSGR